MKYRLAFLICFFVKIIPGFSQTLEEVFEQAKIENKLIMLVVESKECFNCNEIIRSGLSAPSIQKKLKKDAIVLFVSKIPEEIVKPEFLYTISFKFYGVIYLDGYKNIIHAYSGSTSSYYFHEYKLKEAIKERKKEKNNLAELSANYYTGNKSFCETYTLIEKIVNKGLNPKQWLVDTLTQIAPAESTRSLMFLQFLCKTAPEIGSITEKYLYQNPDNYQMAWWRMPADTRIRLNTQMASKSLEKAINQNDKNYVVGASYSIANRYSQNGTPAWQAVRTATLLTYFREVKDTTYYLAMAKAYFDSYLNLNVDSILKIDSAYKDQIRKETEQNKRLYNSSVIASFKVTDYQTQAMKYAGLLNSGAWTNYTFSKNLKHLNDALKWAKKANEFFEAPECMNTYARILYKTNNKSLAIEWQSKAIDLLKSKNSYTTEYEKVLEAMKNGSDKIDEY